MKKSVILGFASVVVGLSVSSCSKGGNTTTGPVSLKTRADSISYMIGLDMGGSIKGLKVDLNFAALNKGIEDKVKDNTALLTEEQAGGIRQSFMQEMQAAAMKESAEKSEKNTTDGTRFLEENKSKPGVVTTASGLQYTVIKEGTGPKPKATDEVSVEYTGTLLDGTEFDASKKHGGPATFRLNQVIPGWTEGVQLMKVGSTYKFFIPSNLAYGENGAGPIGPNQTLIFEIQLLAINGKK